MKIYKVTTEGDIEGRTTKTLGYAQGDRQSIIDYYSPKKYYQIYLEEISIENITCEMAEESKKLLEEKQSLERRLKEIGSII